MYLRKLEMKDAPLMLEWMHDPSVVEKLHTNFAEKTLADAEGFISWSRDNFPEPPAMDVLPDALSGSGSDEFGKLQESEKRTNPAVTSTWQSHRAGMSTSAR